MAIKKKADGTVIPDVQSSALPDTKSVSVILTREPGTFIVGQEGKWHDPTRIVLRDAALMRRQSQKITFERLDVFDGEITINVEGQMAYGTLGEPYLQHYKKFLAAPPVVAPETPSKT